MYPSNQSSGEFPPFLFLHGKANARWIISEWAVIRSEPTRDDHIRESATRPGSLLKSGAPPFNPYWKIATGSADADSKGELGQAKSDVRTTEEQRDSAEGR